MNNFLPITRTDMQERGWQNVDFIFITGDCYVDHPSFGVAILSRLLEDKGYRVAILPQPDWKDETYSDFTRFGEPKLGFFVTAGNIDSMVAHYTAAKRKRSDDAFTAGGKAGSRPDRAVTVYSRILKKLYPSVPVIIGGLEASLRRFAHYDYWSGTVMPSVIFDSMADILVYGMGESQTEEIAKRLSSGAGLESLSDIRGICYKVKTSEYSPSSAVDLPSFGRVKESKQDYAIAARKQYEEADAVSGKRVIQRHDFDGQNYILVQNPPAMPLTTEQLDYIYSFPYNRWYHPSYEALGGVPAIQEVEFSITHNRGCFGACSFCSLAFHQGRAITTRSSQGVINEAKQLSENPRFKGYIHDVGGPTANFRLPSCKSQEISGLCKNKKCLAPEKCGQLQVSHEEYLQILRKIRSLPNVKKVFVRSGIRFDYLIADRDRTFFRELVEHHVSGQLKVAPEHCSAAVLDKMGKPHIESYKIFQDEFYRITGQKGKEQYLVPYLMSSHPGSTLNDAIELALFLKKEKIRPEQVQDFYPTPGTISTAMFYTELDPYSMQKVHVPKTPKEKSLQRALLQYFNPKNREDVLEALRIAGRNELVPKLIPGAQQKNKIGANQNNGKKKKNFKVKKKKN